LTYPGFFEVHSGFLAPFNVEHIAEAPDWGRAPEPIRGEGKLPYLLAWPFSALGGSGVVAIKWGYALSFVLGALGVYAWTRRWLGPRGGVLAAVIYTYLPWHLSTVYVRGAYAEAWLWVFWPVILWSIDSSHAQRQRHPNAKPSPSHWRRGALPLIGIVAALAALWTLPGLFALSVPLFVAYGTALAPKARWRTGRLIGALAITLLLLWVIALLIPDTIPMAPRHLLYPRQLFDAAWGFDLAGSAQIDQQGMSFQLGLAAVGLSIVAVALSLSRRNLSKRHSDSAQAHDVALEEASTLSLGQAKPSVTPGHSLGGAVAFWVVVLAILALLTLSLSAWLWQVSGFDAFLAYPWQLLALAALPLSFLGSSVVRLDRRLRVLPAWAGLVTLVVLASYAYLAPRFTQLDPGPTPVALFQPVGAPSPQIMLLDYEVVPPTTITPTLTLTMTWQTTAPLVDDYTVFVHALAGGDRVAQQDTRPCDGDCPTDTWQPGQIILDRHQLTLPQHQSSGDQSAGAGSKPDRLAVGLYLLETGERASAVGREDGTVYLDVP
jgi:hypothetical protein